MPPPLGKESSGHSQGQTEKENRNNALMLGAGAAALAGIYYYYTREGRSRQSSPSERAARDEEEMRRKAHEAKGNARQAAEAGKTSGVYTVRQAQDRYDEAKVCRDADPYFPHLIYDGIQALAKNKADETEKELSERVRQGVRGAQTKLDEYRDAAEKASGDARKASEQKYEETKNAVGQKAEEARNTGWKLFGFSDQKAEETKRKTAETVSETAEDVKRRAEKQT